MTRKIASGSSWLGRLLLLLVLPLSLAAQSASENFPPLTGGERLVYNLLWPSGLSVGEATLHASHAGNEIHLEATVIADLPQHRVNYTFTSLATEELCSLRFRQRLREGRSSWDESLEFDQEKHIVRRTSAGKTTESAIPSCARDPLTALYHFRKQLALGRVPIGTPEAVGAFYLAGDFSVRYEVVTPETVKLGTKPWEGDRFLISYRGPDGEQSLEAWIRPDAARTPVAVRIRFPMAIFSAELQ